MDKQYVKSEQELAAEIVELNKRQETLLNSINELQRETDGLIAKRTELNDRISALEIEEAKKLKAIDDKTAVTEKTRQAMIEKIVELRAEVEKQAALVALLDVKTETAKENRDKAQAEAKQAIEDFKNAINALDAKNNELLTIQSRIVDAKTDFENVKASIKTAQMKLSELSMEAEQAEASKEDASRQYEKKTEELAKLDERLEAMASSIKKTANEMIDLNKEKEVLAKDVEETRAELLALQGQVRSINSQKLSLADRDAKLKYKEDRIKNLCDNAGINYDDL